MNVHNMAARGMNKVRRKVSGGTVISTTTSTRTNAAIYSIEFIYHQLCSHIFNFLLKICSSCTIMNIQKKGEEKERNHVVLRMQISAVIILQKHERHVHCKNKNKLCMHYDCESRVGFNFWLIKQCYMQSTLCMVLNYRVC